MKSFAQLHEEKNTIELQFLVLELQTAGTFLDVATTTKSEETRARNLRNAAKAYATVSQLKHRVVMTAQRALDLEVQMQSLKARLESLELLGSPPDGDTLRHSRIQEP